MPSQPAMLHCKTICSSPEKGIAKHVDIDLHNLPFNELTDYVLLQFNLLIKSSNLPPSSTIKMPL
ncbi:hypothetical protein NC651_039793 [Populus alba x Populus x berolinensis]|nr:hypothetical protein NC651_039793 [Populus alba x Populus x berolinensis]